MKPRAGPPGRVRRGGAIVIAGETNWTSPEVDIGRIFCLQLRVIGSTGSTREEPLALLRMIDGAGLKPMIDRVLPLVPIF